MLITFLIHNMSSFKKKVLFYSTTSKGNNKLKKIIKFQKEINKNIEKIVINQKKIFIQYYKLTPLTYKNNGMIYIFGTGHSHMLAEEGHQSGKC